MRVILTGASGFLGRAVGKRLAEAGHELRVLGRRAPSWLRAGDGFHRWDAMRDAAPVKALEGMEAVIHLAGEPVAQRWTQGAKQRIQQSRVEGTRALVKAISRLEARPKVLVSASAIGYYGDRGDEVLTERSGRGDGFLADVCVAWEQEALKAEELGLRVSRVRFGVVLGREGGALAKMLPAFRAGLGGPIGKGRQWMSWIHIADAAGMLKFILETPGAGGAWNATAPMPVRNAEFSHTLGGVLRRPAVLAVPRFVLGLVFGEMAGMLTGSQRVEPEAALKAGCGFEYAELEAALKDLLTTR